MDWMMQRFISTRTHIISFNLSLGKFGWWGHVQIGWWAYKGIVAWYECCGYSKGGYEEGGYSDLHCVSVYVIAIGMLCVVMGICQLLFLSTVSAKPSSLILSHVIHGWGANMNTSTNSKKKIFCHRQAEN